MKNGFKMRKGETYKCTDKNESLVLAQNEHYWRVLDIANQKTRMRGTWCTGVE